MSQEIEVTFKVRMRYPDTEELLSLFGTSDVRECFAIDWENAEEEVLEVAVCSKHWTVINVEPYVGEGDRYEIAALASQVLEDDGPTAG
jgi:hypothetical protein